MTWLLYGANGYTGQLVARLAQSVGEQPILAGRSPAAEELADELGLEARVFDLSDAAVLDRNLTGVTAVLHAAGPFSRTSSPMVDACLRAGAHYADLTGEIDVFEAIYRRHDEATKSGVCLVPGVGFDVVPTDHLLATLRQELPDATDADVALISRGGLSAGTLRTAVEGLREGGVVRSHGVLTKVATAHRRRRIVISGKESLVVSIPLGDVASGYHATQIPNITNFTNVPGGALLGRTDAMMRRALGNESIHRAVDAAIGRWVKGPSQSRRDRARSDVWAEVRNDSGRVVRAALRVPSTYEFTAHSALHAIRRIATGEVTPGAWAPSQAFGADFVHTIPGIEVERLDAGAAAH